MNWTLDGYNTTDRHFTSPVPPALYYFCDGDFIMRIRWTISPADVSWLVISRDISHGYGKRRSPGKALPK